MGIEKCNCVWVGKAYKGTSGCCHTMYRTNANMPKYNPKGTDILEAGSGPGDLFATGFICAWYCQPGSYDLSDTCRGFELFMGSAMTRYCVSDTDSLNGIHIRCLHWINCTGATMWADSSFQCIDIPEPGVGNWSWQYSQYMLQIGANGWEICNNGNHYLRSCVGCYSGDDLSIATNCVVTPVSNVPSLPTTGSTRGTIWVEGNDLHFIPEQTTETWEHAMVGCGTGGAYGDGGSIWIGNDNYLYWTNCDGTALLKACWAICQFASWGSGSSGANPSPGAGSAGAIWVDGEFGYSHLAYIGCDGNKYITGAGNYPYTLPLFQLKY